MRVLNDWLREVLRTVDPDSAVLGRTTGNVKFNPFSSGDDTGGP